ncbi:hypothetical protein ACGFYQ_28600 [Streptomyces sp. NPDC048258]|uniref:LppU/SCO3897 family protein n=1 Tax=Streptomyces sp. NPDC048258 TaxID=3365527 RepID=UPI003718E2ED
MSSQEIPLQLTPQQAAHGVILTVELPTGPARVRIPHSRDGDLVRARVGDAEVLLRIRVAGAGAGAGAGAAAGAGGTPRSGPAPGAGGRGCLVALAVLVVLGIGIAVVLNGGDDSDGKVSASSTPTESPSPTPTPSPSAWRTETVAPSSRATLPEPSLEPSPEPSPEPTPYDRGTCLNGSLPDSTTAQRVDDVEEVSCSASDAHYRVIESIPMTSDMDRCNDNPKTQYAFSHRYTINGRVINEYVYCLVGLGSYAR